MVLPDVNLLVYAFRDDVAFHEASRTWLLSLVRSGERFALSDIVCSGFLRVVTNKRIYKTPVPLEDAIDFIARLRSHSNCVIVSPSAGHWDRFINLCKLLKAEGGFVADVYLAALAIDTNCEWCTIDADFARIPGLRLVKPF